MSTLRDIMERAFDAGGDHRDEQMDNCPDFDEWWRRNRGEIISSLLAVAHPDATMSIDLTNTDIRLLLAAIGRASTDRDFGASRELTGLSDKLYDLL